MALHLMTPIDRSLGIIKYFRSSRCFNSAELRRFNQGKLLAKELITFDCGLMELEEVPGADDQPLGEDRQLLAVIVRPEIEPSFLLQRSKDFEFCGYDLVESTSCISAITNCGGEFESIPYERLNSYGLLGSYREAVTAQLDLYDEDPNEPHAYCEIVEIWRSL